MQATPSVDSTEFLLFLLVIMIWELVWKGFALWRAARNSHREWYIVILIFNTIGILPILYLVFDKRRQRTDQT